MTTVVVASLRGAPGATTTAVVLAATAAPAGWLVEADPAGGVLAGRCSGLHGGPGLEALAYPDRRDVAALDTAVQLLGEVRVVTAPYDPWRAHAAVARPRVPWDTALDDVPGLVVVDRGRLGHDMVGAGLLRRATAVLLVTRPDGTDVLVALAWRDRALADGLATVGIVAVGTGAYSPARLATELGDAWWGHLPHDRRAVELLHRGAGVSHRAVRRSALVRSARPLVQRLMSLAPSPVAAVAS